MDGGRRDDPLAPVARAAAVGDRDAARAIVRALAPVVTRVARAVLGAAHPDVEDCAQEALIQLLRALPSFRGDCGTVHFASRIAVRTALASRRRGRALRDRVDPLPEGDDAPRDDEDRSPEAEALSDRRRALWRDLLASLPEAQAEAMGLRVVLGLSLGEVAEATGAPVNTVRSRLRLAREALLGRFEEDPALRERLGVDAPDGRRAAAKGETEGED